MLDLSESSAVADGLILIVFNPSATADGSDRKVINRIGIGLHSRGGTPFVAAVEARRKNTLKRGL